MVLPGEWERVSGTQSGHQVFTRLLGMTETGFYWDSVMNGTADTITHCTITPSHGADYREGLFTAEHFGSAWGTLRCKYPLLGARVERLGDKETCRFVVDDRSLGLVSEAELSVQVISSEAEAVRTVENALNGPRQLSDTVLARCSVLQRSDQPIFHLIFSVAHLITDGMANYTITRTFLNLLAASGPLPPRPDLYQRLQMVPSQESLMPVAHMNMARQRWRRAIAAVILNINQSKMVGGHTLPNMMNAETFETPAKSSQLVISLPPDLSKQVVASCRARGITFGHAYPLLAQLAMARLLYRRYIRGEISRDDWERRIREPTHTGGPLNLRPFLSKDWYNAGGEREVNLCISFFFATMPYMPAGPRGSISATLDQSGAPGFSNLLSHDRFFLRASGVRKQITQFMKHPFFLEMTLARGPSRIARVRDMALAWQARKDGRLVPYTARTSSGTIPSTGLVMQNGGSSFGVVDHLLPRLYPETATNTTSSTSAIRVGCDQNAPPSQTGSLRLLSNTTHLRCRPAELYLGSATVAGEMRMYVFYDANVFEHDIVREWLGEVRDATIHYLAPGTIGGSDDTLAKL